MAESYLCVCVGGGGSLSLVVGSQMWATEEGVRGVTLAPACVNSDLWWPVTGDTLGKTVSSPKNLPRLQLFYFFLQIEVWRKWPSNWNLWYSAVTSLAKIESTLFYFVVCIVVCAPNHPMSLKRRKHPRMLQVFLWLRGQRSGLINKQERSVYDLEKHSTWSTWSTWSTSTYTSAREHSPSEGTEVIF